LHAVGAGKLAVGVVGPPGPVIQVSEFEARSGFHVRIEMGDKGTGENGGEALNPGGKPGRPPVQLGGGQIKQRIKRRQLKAFFHHDLRIFGPVQPFQKRRQIAQCRNVIRDNFQRPPIGFFRRLSAAFRSQCAGKVVMSVEQAGVAFHGPAESGQGGRRVSRLLQRVAQVVVGFGECGVQFHGPAEHPGRFVEAAHLEGKQTGKMVAARIIRPGGQIFPVNDLGAVQPA